MNPETKVFIELYKRKQYQKIPIEKTPDNSEVYYLTPKQLKALEYFDDPNIKFIGFGGSARSGKTVLECFVALFDCLSYPNIAWAIARKELTALRRSVYITFFTLCNFYGLKAKEDYTFDGQNHKITFSNGSYIMFLEISSKPSDPLFTRFGGGLELTRCAVDEANESEYMAITTLAARTGFKNNEKYGLSRKCLETFNPDKGHVYRRYYLPYKKGEEKEDVKFIPSLPSDNPHPQVVTWIQDIIKSGNEILIQRLVKGNFDYDDNPRCLIKPQPMMDFMRGVDNIYEGRKFMSCDIALHGSDCFVIIVWEGWIIIDIIIIPKCDAKNVEHIIRDTADIYDVPLSNIVYDADGLGSFLRGYLKEAIPFNNASAPIYSREEIREHEELRKKGMTIPKNYRNLKTQCLYILAERINASVCKLSKFINFGEDDKDKLMQELSMIQERNEKEGVLQVLPKDEIKLLIGRSPDISDAIMMRVIFDLANNKTSPYLKIKER